MKKGRKIKLRYKKERVLLSDVLPYELPIIMSNRMLYRFCVKNKIRYDQCNKDLFWDKKIDEPSFEVVKLLFGAAFDKSRPLPAIRNGYAKLTDYSTIPFIFHTRHKQTEFRALSIVHPALQIGVLDFYNQFKSLIIHYCNRSSFSMRYPHKVASYFYYKDKLHHVLLGKKKDNIELFFNEYENLKTYFSYKKYTQIYRFFDDYRFQRAEKRFSYLFRFDIQKCFDSIYTHTIAWATQGGKEIYKKDFQGKDTNSFGGKFDVLMQRLNYNETNGIVIGPEFSRIFAEIILQHIDRNVEIALLSDDRNVIYNGKDYQLYRYVDDYFLFYNEESVKNRIFELFHRNLEEYKLRISSEKCVNYNRPFLTDISKAKIRIDQLINTWFKYRSNDSDKGSVDEADISEKDSIEEDDDSEVSVDFKPDIAMIESILSKKGYFPLVSRKFNQAYKDSILTVGVEHKDVVNYTLSCICTRVERELKKFDKRYKYLKRSIVAGFNNELKLKCEDHILKLEHRLSKYLCDVVDSAFFLFAACPRLNATLKIMRLLNAIIIYLNGIYNIDPKKDIRIQRFTNIIRSQVFSQIHLEVLNVFERSKCHDYAQLEILYLLINMRMIDSKHSIKPELLDSFLGLDAKKFHLNEIAISTILYYIGNKGIYTDLKDRLVSHICEKLQHKNVPDYRRDAESVILILDMCCCPYLNKTQKDKILSTIGFDNATKLNLMQFGKRNRYMFTKWSGVNITKELAAKVSQEVYS